MRMTRPAGPVIRGSAGDLLLRTKWGGGVERDEGLVRITTRKRSGLHQDPNVLRKAQGLNAQGKGEVQILISGRGGAIQAEGEVLMWGAIELHIL
jgi:hypothetical protein